LEIRSLLRLRGSECCPSIADLIQREQTNRQEAVNEPQLLSLLKNKFKYIDQNKILFIILLTPIRYDIDASGVVLA
jgi:hypothetical protein